MFQRVETPRLKKFDPLKIQNGPMYQGDCNLNFKATPHDYVHS